ncbi:MAG: TULIP family P47-like protein [Verrucomicrobiaceae bacterium]|nr:TULIP family P47-like protein [Verrucomicrobiaceae bacterium]
MDTASTNGWDTVFAMHIAEVNRAIAKAGTSPAAFEVTDAEDGITATGRFGTWQIVPGGDGALVCLGIPITEVLMHCPPPMPAVTIASALLKVEVRLSFLHAAEEAGTGNTHHLKVRTTPLTTESESHKVAIITDIAFPGTKPSFLVQASLQALLEAWLNENLGDFDHIFATIDLSRTADKEQFHWMQPTDHAYAYSDLGTKEDGALAILCMTQGRSPTGLIEQLSYAAIAPGQRAGFLISKERILAQMILPAMPRMFPGTSSADFALSASGDSIINAHDSVSFTATDDGGKEHSAKIISLSLRIEAGELQLDVQTVTDLSPGIRARCHTQNFLAIALITKPDGTQTLGFSDARPALIEHWTDHDQGFDLAGEILLVASIVALAVATVATAGTALAAAALIAGIVIGVGAAAVAITEKAIEMAGENDAPAIDSMLLNATAPIIWPDSTDFKLTSAQLNDSLQLSGTFLAVT